MPDAPAARILLVEDDEAVGSVVFEVLEDEGYEVHWARDGRAGLEALARSPADLILLDLMMPVLDGPGFRSAQLRLTDDRARIPVLVLSGAREASATAAELGAIGTVRKPFQLDDLIRQVSQALAAA